MRSIRDSYDEWLRELPEATRSSAKLLPYRLGLTRSETGSWEDFVLIEPDRVLPWYAAQVPHDESRLIVTDAQLDLFLRAHHAAGFHGLLCDRIDDGQVASSPEFIRLRGALLERWRSSLSEAVGSDRYGARLVSEALRTMRLGTRLEAHVRADPTLRARYGHAIGLKLDWIVVAARALLERFAGRERALSFSRAFHLVLLALQCRDDVADAREDQELHGISTAEALGVSGAALLQAASQFLLRAEHEARDAGFTRLANWSHEYTARSTGSSVDASVVRDAVGGLLLSWAIGANS